MTTIFVDNLPPIKANAFTFYLSLVSQADTDIFQVNPTLAAGDVRVSIDGGGLANITALPVAIGAGKVLAVSLTAAEMNGDKVCVIFSDVAGNEWQDAFVEIVTEVNSGQGFSPAIPYTKNVAYTFYTVLVSQADTDIFQNNPTLAVGDVKVSINGGALNNITILPTAIAAGKILSVPLSAAEMNGDVIVVQFSDILGNEWQDSLITLRTQSPINVLGSSALINGDDISIIRGDTFELAFTFLGNITGWTKVWFTVKADKDDIDTQSIIQIVESNPGVATDGLLSIQKAAPTALANGSITVNNIALGNITARVEAVETAKLDDCGSFYYDIQVQNATDTITLLAGRATIIGDSTRTV